MNPLPPLRWSSPEIETVARICQDKLSIMRCHDWDHTLRVLRNARDIAGLEKIDVSAELPILELAALLHDIARPDEQEHRQNVCHAKLGAARVPGILRDCHIREDWIAPVQGCVRRHRFRSDDAPQTKLEKIIYDADKLDALGAVGIGRAFYFAGRLGNRLHNTREEALNSPEYGVEDTAFREFLVKLRHIPGKMMTASGRELAAERLRFTQEFFEELNFETYGISPGKI